MDPRTMAALRAVVKDLEAQTERRTAGCASCGDGQRCDKGEDLLSAFQEETKDGR